MTTNLDIDCLRTFVAIIDLGSFAEAARRVGRTPSAVSLQIRRLEERLGTKLFGKVGRRMAPTPEGETLLVTARQVLALNDQAVEALAHRSLSGEVAIGAIQDIAENLLPGVLSRFAKAHPGVRITAKVDRSKRLAEMVEEGTLDLAIGVHGWSGRPHDAIRTEPMVWLGGENFVPEASGAVPLVVFEPPCGFRDAAIESLNRKGRTWEIVFTSPSLSGLRAAVEAGLGVTVRTPSSFEGKLQRLPAAARLPKLPSVRFALYRKADLGAPAARLCEIVTEVLQTAHRDFPNETARQAHAGRTHRVGDR